MGSKEILGGRDRIVRTLLASALAVAAVGLFRRGRRVTGALAGLGAVAVVSQATPGSSELQEALGGGATTEDAKLTCAICGQPIVPGQPRGPDENDETVHVACRETTAGIHE